MNTQTEIILTIKGVANRIAQTQPQRSAELLKIAQYLDSPSSAAGAVQDLLGNSGQGGSEGPIHDFQESGEPDPGSYQQNLSGGHPDIEPFVKMNIDKPQVDDRTEHTLTVTLRAPQDISESDMMNYMLKMKEAHDVDVFGFKWTKSEPKQTKSV